MADCFPDNVFLATKPVDVKHGFHSVLLGEFSCMSDLVGISKKWKYYINLTGEEFPLVTNLELVSFLRRLHGINLIDGKCLTILTTTLFESCLFWPQMRYATLWKFHNVSIHFVNMKRVHTHNKLGGGGGGVTDWRSLSFIPKSISILFLHSSSNREIIRSLQNMNRVNLTKLVLESKSWDGKFDTAEKLNINLKQSLCFTFVLSVKKIYKTSSFVFCKNDPAKLQKIRNRSNLNDMLLRKVSQVIIILNQDFKFYFCIEELRQPYVYNYHNPKNKNENRDQCLEATLNMDYWQI